MEMPAIIQNSLDYIEDNLKTELAAGELAAMAGYSVFHFCRIFAEKTGMPVAGYIQKRRIDHALAEISSGRKAIEVVLEYGFETYSGFFRAFVRLYGCSPRRFRQLYPGIIPRPLRPEVIGTMYSEKELRAILAHWDIDASLPIQNVYIMDGAKVSGNDWRVGEDYLLSTGDRQSVVKDRAIAKALAKQGFQSRALVPTREGADFLEGTQPFFLAHGLRGVPLDKDRRFGDLRQAFGAKYGQAIARLHRALKEIQRDYPADEINLYKTITEWALPKVEKQDEQWEMGLGHTFFVQYKTHFGALYAQLPRQLIHRNPNPSTILFDGSEVTGFIDFDMTEINVRLWDPCYCATGILSEGPDYFDKWLDILRGILRGYNEQAKLTKAEKEAVFHVICSIQMICIVYFQGIDKPEFQQLAKTNREMLTFIVQNRPSIDTIF